LVLAGHSERRQRVEAAIINTHRHDELFDSSTESWILVEIERLPAQPLLDAIYNDMRDRVCIKTKARICPLCL
jgi:hypothetical protein